MKKHLQLFLLAGIFLITIACNKTTAPAPAQAGAPVPAAAPSVDSIKCLHYDEKSFRRSISRAKDTESQGLAFQGGISPHHLLADDLIASFFKTAANTEPDLVFILAPNHKRVGLSKIHTCLSRWETPFGLLETDTAMVKALIPDYQAALNTKLMETEHSISSLIPYIKYYWPDTKVVPLLLHGDMPMENAVNLGNRIAEKVKNKKAFVLASIDFSHYLPLETADQMDATTLEAIKHRNLEQIRKMSNDNLDSPPTLITFLSAMTALKADRMTQAGHSNSDRIANVNTGNTTSYFTLLFN